VIFEFEGQKFDTDKIKQLYPAAMIPTGYKDELTQISLEWYDTEDSGIEAKKWAIFIHLADKSVLPFYYQTREKLENAIEKLANVLNS
jgi:hypothetical protein